MRVIAITPVHVTEEEFNRRQARYDRISPDGLKVVLINFSELEPKELETSLDVLASDLGLIADIHSINREDFDFLMPDCVLDPGFRQDGDKFVRYENDNLTNTGTFEAIEIINIFINGSDEMQLKSGESKKNTVWYFIVPNGLTQEVIINYDVGQAQKNLIIDPFSALFKGGNGYKIP